MKTFHSIILAMAVASAPLAAAPWTPAVKPLPLNENVSKGLAWLVEHQNPDGGWSQGEESRRMKGSGGGKNPEAVSNVADTGMAALALLRAGKDERTGELIFAKQIERALAFVCEQIEQADADSLSVTSLQGTRVQMKIGTFVDTFVASLLLAEAKPAVPDGEVRSRVEKALNKVLAKIEKNQKPDGTWAGSGWATDISQAIAGKAMNRAAQAGAPVSEPARSRTESSGRASYDKESGNFPAAQAAGVELYAAGKALAQMQDSANTNQMEKATLEEASKNAKSADEREAAGEKLKKIAENEKDLAEAKAAVINKMEKDDRFISGFGSNGGEEFLSYMNIGESLVIEGGSPWENWSTKMREALARVQNRDGSWSGEHCITGRTFCTATALLVLMVDRAPVPLAAQLKRR